MLFDSGAHPELRTNARERLGPAADLFDARLEPEHTVPGLPGHDRPRRRGTSTSSCSRTCTSTTPAGSSTWAHAPVYVQQAELDFAHAPPDDQRRHLRARGLRRGLRLAAAARRPRPVRRRQRAHRLHAGPHRRATSRCSCASSQTVFLLSDAAYLVDKMRARRLPGVLWSAGGDAGDVGPRGGASSARRTRCCSRRTRSTTRRASAWRPMPGTSSSRLEVRRARTPRARTSRRTAWRCGTPSARSS